MGKVKLSNKMILDQTEQKLKVILKNNLSILHRAND